MKEHDLKAKLVQSLEECTQALSDIIGDLATICAEYERMKEAIPVSRIRDCNSPRLMTARTAARTILALVRETAA